MDQITLFAPAKINLTLDITGKRPDGYHLLDSLFCTVDLLDTIHIQKTLSGVQTRCPGVSSESNIATRAARAFFERSALPGGATIDIEKHIPMQAGLGGGSTDCAGVLSGLNALYGAPLDTGELLSLAQRLGADVPFFFTGGLARAQGIGEVLTPLPGAKPMFFVLLKPKEGLSTQEIYSGVDLCRLFNRPDNNACIQALLQGNFSAFGAHTGNVLYPVAQKLLPKLEDIRQSLLSEGAKAAFMTGSGSCMVGLFDTDYQASQAADVLGGIFCRYLELSNLEMM